MIFTREHLDEVELAKFPDALRMDRAIQKLRDEVTGTSMKLHRGQSRELAMVMTRLDEAALWASRWLEQSGQVARVDRGRLLADGTVATDATVTREGDNV